MKKRKKFLKKMRSHLWVKIYGVVFLSIIALILLLVKIWQYSNINYLFNREKSSVIEHQQYVSEVLYNVLSFYTLEHGEESILSEEFKNAIQSAFYYKLGEFALFYNDDLIVCSYQEIDDMDKQLLTQKSFAEECHLEKYTSGKSYYMKSVSSIALQKREYLLITTTDISGIYKYQHALMCRIAIVCIAGGIIIALLLLAVFKVTFQPLKDINENVRTIAAGNYDKRLNVKSTDELGELACNVNEMAQAVGDNVKSLRDLASEQKRFIDNLTHEMKTPLTSIISFADIIQIDGNITREKAASHARIIAQEGRRLSVISQKLMDFIHIGKIDEEDKTEVSMKMLLEDISTTMKPMLEKKNICLKKAIQDYTLKIDYELFKTMLCNYVDNAMKASEENSTIEIKSYKEEKVGIVKIKDYGIGIPEEEINKIEEPFYMVDKSRSRKEGGAGLGMALCKKIAAAHDGQVQITSKIDEGTEIKLIFCRNDFRSERF